MIKNISPKTLNYLGNLAGPAIVAVATVVMLVWSWGKWLHPMIDFGRELYVPWRLSTGERLYADIAYFNGPLSPYVNAAWFKIFGVSLRSLYFSNLLILAILITMLYWLFKQLSGQLTATICCLTFILLFAFSQYVGIANFNFMCPYSHEATHGLTLAFASLVCFALYLRKERNVFIFAMGLCVGLIFLTKLEVFVAAFSTAVLALGLIFWTKRMSLHQCIQIAAYFCAGAVLPVVIGYVLLSSVMSDEVAFKGIFSYWAVAFNKDMTRLPIFSQGMGTDDLRGNLSYMLIGTAIYMAFVAAGLGIGWITNRWKLLRWIALLIIILGIIITLITAYRSIPFFGFGKPLPLLLLILGGFVFGIIIKHRADSCELRMETLRLVVVFFAFIFLLKIFFNVRLYHYGFFLAAPATLVVVASLTGWIPVWAQRLQIDKTVFCTLFLCLLLVVTGAYIADTNRRYKPKIYTMSSDNDAFEISANYIPVSKILDQIEKNIFMEQTLAVIPEGVLLNYLTRRKNPTPYINFLPSELIIHGQSNMLTSLKTNPPDYIYIIPRKMNEYGFRGFGRDYGLDIYGWIVQNYRLVNLSRTDLLFNRQQGIVFLRYAGSRPKTSNEIPAR